MIYAARNITDFVKNLFLRRTSCTSGSLCYYIEIAVHILNKRNRNSHYACIVIRNILYFIDVYSVIVVIFRILRRIRVVAFSERQFLSWLMKTCHPCQCTNTFNIMVRSIKIHTHVHTTAADAHFIFLYIREYIFICYRVLIGQNDEILLSAHNRVEPAAEQTERRIRYDYIAVQKEVYRIHIPEIAVRYSLGGSQSA